MLLDKTFFLQILSLILENIDQKVPKKFVFAHKKITYLTHTHI